ncbi:MAG TPA: heavy-metal-associated domain-containing protein [Steroidobacteraceae bacterium]|nr:heavy-metal-associated domain-containing protein [Steroidobacteraceae bacterium]
MVCGFCAAGVEKSLRQNPATQDVVISLEHRLVAVITRPGTDISDDTLRKTLEDSGYAVKVIARTNRSLTSIRQQMKAEG